MGLDEKISDQVSGFLLLLLLVLLLFSSRIFTLRPHPEEAVSSGFLFVQVGGDVRSPGVYPFKSPPTVQELMDHAGGLKQKGALVHVQPGWGIASGAKVIFSLDGKSCSVTRSRMSAFHRMTLGILLSLNEESEEGLTAVPGIGPSLAKAIVDERTRRGGFKDLDELTDIPGIGPSLFARIRSYLSL